MASLNEILYFGYGSNMWLDQMHRRCPDSPYAGIAILKDWRWFINDRGYANVIPSPGDVVYGLVFRLSQSDERSLDVYEGVPESYIKKMLSVEYMAHPREPLPVSETIDALVYVDEIRQHDDKPVHEYIYRMNMAIGDAVKEGVPQEYVEKYLRPFIPS
ncbi:hypothetical protein ONZ45_g10048 [Pleurotus djamor]|nr:hypothetical protein ONZ45_g16252 [Pleurotus djamor]KAJ8507595.1 hypothetical protein ONZ45_g10048 [Pleurotus djamor]